MLGINVSAERAHGWVGPGMGSAIFSIVVLLVLIGSVAFGIFAAANTWGSQSSVIAPPPAPPPAVAPAPPVAPPPAVVPTPTEPDKHIIPQTTPTPPEPKTHEYVYNVLEFQIASIPPRAGETGWLSQRLQTLGYDVSREAIDLLRQQHGVKTGDVVLVRGKVIGHRDSGSLARGAVVEFEGISGDLSTFSPRLYAYIEGKPQWLSEMIERFETGEEVVITLRGTVNSLGVLEKCELVE